MAGTSLTELFEYASTVKTVDYPKFFAYAGLNIDTATMPAAYLGVSTGVQINADLIINSVDAKSPASQAGLRANDRIITIEGGAPSADLLNNTIKTMKSGEGLKLRVLTGNRVKDLTVILGSKYEKTSPLQQWQSLIVYKK